MSQPMTRGHVIMHTATFLQQSASMKAPGVEAETSLELRTELEGMTAATFYPRRLHTELLSMLATARGTAGTGNDPGYTNILRCGAALLSPENQFSVLLMKVLTPDLFIKKLPRFWQRDHGTSGRCDVQNLDSAAHRAHVRLTDVAGYQHIGIFWLGWLSGMLRELTGTAPDVRQTGWSRDATGPNEIVYEVNWS
jgi:hypothetical protein